MQQSVNDIHGMEIIARDGEIGQVGDLYFDNRLWIVRYFVADIGGWLTGRKVLISPEAVEKPDWTENKISINLTKKQIKESPSIDLAKPVSRQYEVRLHNFFRWTPYWLMDAPYVPDIIAQQRELEKESRREKEEEPEKTEKPNLRSSREVINYYINAKNGEIGHVEDFIMDDDNWRLTHIIVDTRNWLPGGKKVMVANQWIERVDWGESKVYVEITREVIRNSPQFKSQNELN